MEPMALIFPSHERLCAFEAPWGLQKQSPNLAGINKSLTRGSKTFAGCTMEFALGGMDAHVLIFAVASTTLNRVSSPIPQYSFAEMVKVYVTFP